MDFLNLMFLDNTVAQWATALAIAAAVFFALKLVNGLVIKHLRSLSERTENELDDLGAAVLARTKAFFLVLLGVYAGAHFLALPDRVSDVLDAVAVLAFLAQAGIWSTAAIGLTLHRHAERRLEQDDAATATTVRFMGFLLRVALWAIILLVALGNLGIDVTALVTGLGIGGLAIALAMQNVLRDLFGSLSIVLDKPFVIGDFMIVGDMMGTVEHIGLKTTRVRSLSGEQLVFANNDLLNSRIRNYQRMAERRILFQISVTYGTPYDTVKAIPEMIREVVEAQEKTRFDRAHFAKYGDSSLVFEIVYYVLEPDYNVYMDIQQAINLALYERFEAEGIDFAFPTRTLHLDSVPAGVAAGAAAGTDAGDEGAAGDAARETPGAVPAGGD